MKVYLLVNDAPEQFGGYHLIAIFSNLKKARKRLEKLKKSDEYTYQYYVIFSRKVIQ